MSALHDLKIPAPNWKSNYEKPEPGSVFKRLQRDLDQHASHPSHITGYVHRSNVLGDNEVFMDVNDYFMHFGVEGDFALVKDEDGNKPFVPTAIFVSPATNIMPLLAKYAPTLLDAIVSDAAFQAREEQR